MATFKSVLLVDDSRADNFLHKELIRESEFAEAVLEASDGVAALEFLQTGPGDNPPEVFPPQLIFLDINMPRMDGFEFLEALKALPEEKRAASVIVMLTTSLNPEDEKRARETGMVSEFLHKPLSIATLERLKKQDL